jgi:hypothetical protein
MSCLRIIAVVCAGLFLSPGTGVSHESSGPGPASVPLKLTIRPAEPGYDLINARMGNITILARVQNSGTQSVLLAHPNISFPHELKEGQSLKRDPSQSYLSVLIETPRGATTVLSNNGLRMFEPGNQGHLTIMPGESKEFRLGWFGPEYSVGQWNIEKPVFTETGRYRITVRYKNTYPVAYIFEREGKWSVADAWTGEFQSNTISLPIR